MRKVAKGRNAASEKGRGGYVLVRKDTEQKLDIVLLRASNKQRTNEVAWTTLTARLFYFRGPFEGEFRKFDFQHRLFDSFLEERK